MTVACMGTEPQCFLDLKSQVIHAAPHFPSNRHLGTNPMSRLVPRPIRARTTAGSPMIGLGRPVQATITIASTNYTFFAGSMIQQQARQRDRLHALRRRRLDLAALELNANAGDQFADVVRPVLAAPPL
jgi:hypothetical protein